MKRLFSFVMALVLVLSLGATAFADENPATLAADGSITITNATIGDTYKLFKIFNATYSVDNEGKKAVSYSIEMPTEETDEVSRHIFETLFGADGKASNPYFIYNPETDEVTSNGTINKSDLSKYMNDLVAGLTPVIPEITADSEEETFANLEFGYYVIDKAGEADATVTITSAAPTIKVIDKNQKPGNNFNKLVKDEDKGTEGEWVTDSSANIGDIVDFKVEFEATNYNGDKMIKHYIIGDQKGNALWVEFNSINVTVNGTSAGKGWYHCANNAHVPALNTGEWTSEKDPDQWAATADDAGWYLIHHGYDDFEIVIPWVADHTFTANGDAYELEYPEEPTSKYDSPVNVVIEYSASVEPNANIDGPSNLTNEADLSWKDDTIVTHPDTPDTDLTVHALGITKFDGDTNELLAGAVFEIFSDSNCTQAVYVIPTDVKGVYILDDLDTLVSGENRETSREKYAAHLEDYLKDEKGKPVVQKNEVVTQLNGKLVVLGLEKGTYYLKETAAPDGYNKLVTPVVIEINGTTEEYTFDTNDDGVVVEKEDATQTHTYHKVEGEKVENNKGVELPSTGGEGAMKMITIGTMVAMVFAVLLITHKKMSIYHD